MGTTYQKALDQIMTQYDKAWEKAEAEFNKYGEVSEDTNNILIGLETELALLESAV